MVFDAETIKTVIMSCDERIASVQAKMDNVELFGKVLSIVNLDMEEKHKSRIENFKNNIKLIQVEKLIYQSLAKTNNSSIFPVLLSKYDNLLGVSYDISGNMVVNGGETEGNYLDYCKQSLDQREYIKKLCMYGEKR
jgi:hypothetical protein